MCDQDKRRGCRGVRLRSPQRRSRQRRAAVLVEFALVAPVFLLIVFICIEFCRLNMIRNLTQDAAYYATRHCMVPGATAKEAEAEARRILAAMGTKGAKVMINNGNGLDTDSSAVEVQITVPVAQNALFAPKFTGSINFSATTVMRTERHSGFYDLGS